MDNSVTKQKRDCAGIRLQQRINTSLGWKLCVRCELNRMCSTTMVKNWQRPRVNLEIQLNLTDNSDRFGRTNNKLLLLNVADSDESTRAKLALHIPKNDVSNLEILI